MKIIDPIHNEFHKIAENIKILTAEGKTSEAEELLKKEEAVKSDITQKLQDLHSSMLSNNTKLMIVLQSKDGKVGIIVDNAESVEFITEIQELPPAAVLNKYIKKMGLRKKDRSIILILEASDFA